MKKQLCLSSALIISAGILGGCGSFGKSIKDIDDLEGKKVAAQLDTTAFTYASDLKSVEVKGYNVSVDMFSALNKSIVDAVVIDEATAEEYIERNNTFRLLDDKLSDEAYSIAFNKNNAELGQELNHAITMLKSNGVFDEIASHWIGEKADKVSYVPDENIQRDGEITVYTNAVYPPYESITDEGIVGIDIDVIMAVGDFLGKNVIVKNKSFSEIFEYVENEENSIGIAAITPTAEREEQVDFTDSYIVSKQVVVVKDK